jgi:hypothetical protein
MRSAAQLGARAKVVKTDTQVVLARAEGIAAGQGSAIVAPEYVLLSLLWARTSLFAVTLLQRAGAIREGVLDELERRGVSLGVRCRWPVMGRVAPDVTGGF